MTHVREFSTVTEASSLSSHAAYTGSDDSLTVNDIHSQLNRTLVDSIIKPRTVLELQEAVSKAKAAGKPVSIAGARHSMGGQPFGTGMVLIDMTDLNQVISFDQKTGLAEVQAGAFWPQFTETYLRLQQDSLTQWGFAQKQTGADNISIGGTLAANGHGRGLTMQPFISNVESFTLVDAKGALLVCSREENAELFRLAIGGYGLFGVIATATLRLVPRQKIQRVVEIRRLSGLMAAFDQRISEGFLYGDFQFAIDPASDDFLNKGVFSCYRLVDQAIPIPPEKGLSDEGWRTLLYLAHSNKKEAFRGYADYYRSTDGQLYWSDTHQMSFYPENYHHEIDRIENASTPASEIITEINVPREQLESFLAEARDDFRKNDVNLIYGTVRLIERDDESFLPWARQSYACTIFNLHTVHSPEGIEHSAEAFRRLIDMAAKRDGSYFLTYHRYARREQVLACYPNFAEFLSLKRKYDPEEHFQSDWYRHYRSMFEDAL